jgi:hypothetical protein
MNAHREQIILLVSGVGTPRERSENTPEVDGNSTEATAQLMEVSCTLSTYSTMTYSSIDTTTATIICVLIGTIASSA